jgi:hypothetical protein
VEDYAFGKHGLTVTLWRSKIDQTGEGRKIGIPYGSNPETCPVRTIQAWTEQAGVTAGPLFRSINRHGRVQGGRLSGIDVARVKEFKKHLKDLAHGHHHPEEHDWAPDGKAAGPKEPARAIRARRPKSRTTRKAKRRSKTA